MTNTFRGKARKWLVVGGLLLLMSITSVGSVLAADLTDEEVYWLTYMREEEKLARDVYIYLFGMYGSRVFDNISVSEQRHMDAIKILLDRYGIPDPVGMNTDPLGQDVKGVFFNGDLQALYTALINGGSGSLIQALKVGVFIEETDIADLNEGIASAKHKDIKTVYSHLLQGSLNHLKAFVSELASNGVTYEP